MVLNKKVVIYTDGSVSKARPKIEGGGSEFGGMGIYMQYKEGNFLKHEGKWRQGFKETTIDRMELRALCFSLELMKRTDLPVIVVIDRQNIVDSINLRWVWRWKQEGWVDASKKNGKRLNIDLWKWFLEQYKRFPNLTIVHTRGHGKGKSCYKYGNDIADQLADYSTQESYIEDTEWNG